MIRTLLRNLQTVLDYSHCLEERVRKKRAKSPISSFLKHLHRQTKVSPGRLKYFLAGMERLARKRGMKKSHPNYWSFVTGMTKYIAHRTRRKTMRGSKHTLTGGKK